MIGRRGHASDLGLVLALSVAAAACGRSRRAPEPPTFTRDVAPIIFRRCAPCHRPGESGPFPLLSFEDVSRRARQIGRVTQRRVMPPWKALPADVRYANDRSLSDAELGVISAWIAAGAPEGARGDLVPAPEWPAGWRLGTPDLVATLPAPYALAADGRDVYRNLILRADVDRSRYVAAWELRSGSPSVHHAILNLDRLGWAERKDAEDDEPGYPGLGAGELESPDGFYLVWTPGKEPTKPIAGTAWRLDPSTDMVLQLHMRPSGRPELVAPVIGLYFTDQAPTRPRLSLRLGDLPIDLAPGQTDFRMIDAGELPADAELLGLFPHAHSVARTVRVWATRPGGERLRLLDIDDWDPSWQDEYVLDPPLALPAGTRLEIEIGYDNSAANERNPNRPPARVVTGERSEDEMGNVTFALGLRDQHALATLREFKYRRLLRFGDSSRGHYNLANALARLGRTDDAIASYRRALELDPDNASAHHNLAGVLLGRRDHAGAIAALREAIRVRPRSVDSVINLGAALLTAGRAAEARDAYARAVELDETSIAARGGLAQALEKLGRRDDAIVQLRAGLAHAPDDPALTQELARMLRAAP